MKFHWYIFTTFSRDEDNRYPIVSILFIISINIGYEPSKVNNCGLGQIGFGRLLGLFQKPIIKHGKNRIKFLLIPKPIRNKSPENYMPASETKPEPFKPHRSSEDTPNQNKIDLQKG